MAATGFRNVAAAIPRSFLYSVNLNLSSTSPGYMGTIKRLSVNSATGRFCPSEVLSEPSSLRDPAIAGLWLDGSIIIPFACYGHTGNCPEFIIRYDSLSSMWRSWRT